MKLEKKSLLKLYQFVANFSLILIVNDSYLIVGILLINLKFNMRCLIEM